MFEAIVSSNGWDGVTAALQLLSHLDGDALNVALLVPAPRRVVPVPLLRGGGGLVDALTEHYSSPGRLADYRRWFERASREPGIDPSVFAVELETLAMRAFGDLSPLARLQLVRDRFIAGQVGCTLHRHLDSVEPETAIRDIVDRCCVWESHAEFVDHQGDSPTRRQPLPVCPIEDMETVRVQAGASVGTAPEDQDLLGTLMRHLLRQVVSPPEATPIPSERDLLIQSLMGNIHPVQQPQQERSIVLQIKEILLQNLLPVGSPVMEEPRLIERQNRSSGVCFSCGELSHAASRCPALNEMFPFLPMGWQADRVGERYVMRSPRMMADRRRTGNVD